MRNRPLALVKYARAAPKWIAILAFASISVSGAWADSKAPNVPLLPKVQAECAACHIAYPAGMLPAPSWKRLMGSLDHHYGTDASLDEASVHEEPPQDRITTSAWFVRKHDELAPAIWKQAAVKSAANCIACHTRADKGSFREREITFPKGLDARFRRHWSD